MLELLQNKVVDKFLTKWTSWWDLYSYLRFGISHAYSRCSVDRGSGRKMQIQQIKPFVHQQNQCWYCKFLIWTKVPNNCYHLAS